MAKAAPKERTRDYARNVCGETKIDLKSFSFFFCKRSEMSLTLEDVLSALLDDIYEIYFRNLISKVITQSAWNERERWVL